MASNEELPVHLEEIPDGVVMCPQGDIDLSKAPALRARIAEVFEGGHSRVIVDLGEVQYMDSSGVATLVEGMQIATRTGTKFILTGLQERVRSIFEIARLDMVFTITSDRETAERA